MRVFRPAALLLLAACFACGPSGFFFVPVGGPDAGVEETPPDAGEELPSSAPEVVTGSYTDASGTRGYRVYKPSRYHPALPATLVVALHGCTQGAAGFEASTGLDALAEEHTFLVLYPEQASQANATGCWNWFDSKSQTRDQGEAGLLAGMTMQVMRKWAIHPSRVYLTGISAGAAMAINLAATYPDLYAAAAVHAGCQYKGFPCTELGSPNPETQGDLAYAAMGPRARVVPIIVFQGTADTLVPPGNSARVIAQWARTNDRAFDGAPNGDIDAKPDLSETGVVPQGRSYTHEVYKNTANDEVVLERYLVDGMGHAYSGGAAGTPFSDPGGPDATRISYEFFRAHPQP